MAIRPGDSTPKFDLIPDPHEQDSGRLFAPPAPAPAAVDSATTDFRESALDESEDLPGRAEATVPMMVPHFSDGTTDVLVRGREEIDPGDLTEPMFPCAGAAGEPHDVSQNIDDAATVQLTCVDAGPPPATVAEKAKPTVVAASPAAVTPAPVSAPIAAAAPAADGREAPGQPGGLLFILLLSYASAVTIALLYLLLTRGGGAAQRHQLEDLRDPADEEGTVRIIQRSVELPLGHTLPLQGSQRFGNILVEPLRVTQGPIQFQHFSRDTKKRQPPTPPVYKLWLRLTNVSKDQEIAPLDGLLLYKRALNSQGNVVANAFLCRVADEREGPIVFTYPASPASEWDMLGQDLGRVLKPGESLETFIPSDLEGLDRLEGDLVWRFQLRKGYARTGRGVTTLVRVEFPHSRVEAEPAPPTGRKSSLLRGIPGRAAPGERGNLARLER